MPKDSKKPRMTSPPTPIHPFRNDDQEPPSRHNPQPEALDEAEESYASAVQKWKGNAGCRVKVSRQIAGGRRQLCFTGTPNEIESDETIRQYHAAQTWAHEEGVYFVSLEVGGETREVFPVNIAPQKPTQGVGLPTVSPSSDPILNELRIQNQRLEQLLLGRREEPSSMMEMIQGLGALDQMRGSSGTSADTILKSIELGQKLAGGGAGGDESWGGVVKDLVRDNGPVILGVLKGFMAARPNGGAQAPTPPGPSIAGPMPAAPGPVVAAPVPVNAAAEEHMKQEQEDMALLQDAIFFLKRKAEKRSDPTLYVDMIEDNREEPVYARLISQILDNEFSAFVQLDPDIGREPYTSFFGAIFNGVRHIFKPTDTVETVTTRPGGNTGDAPRNGTTGKSGGK